MRGCFSSISQMGKNIFVHANTVSWRQRVCFAFHMWLVLFHAASHPMHVYSGIISIGFYGSILRIAASGTQNEHHSLFAISSFYLTSAFYTLRTQNEHLRGSLWQMPCRKIMQYSCIVKKGFFFFSSENKHSRPVYCWAVPQNHVICFQRHPAKQVSIWTHFTPCGHC